MVLTADRNPSKGSGASGAEQAEERALDKGEQIMHQLMIPFSLNFLNVPVTNTPQHNGFLLRLSKKTQTLSNNQARKK